MIKIIDNFISEQTQKYYSAVISNISWNLLENITYTEYGDDNNSGFIHIIYDYPNILNYNLFNLTSLIFFEAMEKFEVDVSEYEIYRCRLGLFCQNQISNLNDIHHTPHIDSANTHFTFLYYVCDSDGATYIFDNNQNVVDEIEPKMGRGVLLSGDVYHASSCPRKHQKRIVLNCNFGHNLAEQNKTYWR